MSRYFAELDESNVVLRVIVCDDPQWIADRLGGTWVETVDPYVEAGEVAYCGPGWGYDPDWPVKFASKWRQPVALPDGTWTWYDEGATTFHNGRLWVSTTPKNVWEPGVSAWHPAPTGGQPPAWQQPTGEHDAYRIGQKVMHRRPQGNPNPVPWECTQGDGAGLNSWEPGVFGWTRL